jgi:glycosyltransferase involved in cell wall biosynthesis
MKRIATLDSEELDRMRLGLERAATDHSWQRIVHAYLELYEAVNKGASVSELAPLSEG